MQQLTTWCLGTLMVIVLISCQEGTPTTTESPSPDTVATQAAQPLNSYIALFEIPATDIKRAIRFYEAILGLAIEHMDIQGMQMGILPYEGQLVPGVIIQGEGYQPSADGVSIYLNGGDDLQSILDKVEPNGGQIVLPKTAHADESGFFAMFLDTEGNKIGLNSPH